MKAGEPIKVSVDVMNIGEREGDEVVQLYLTDSRGVGARADSHVGRFRSHFPASARKTHRDIHYHTATDVIDRRPRQARDRTR